MNRRTFGLFDLRTGEGRLVILDETVWDKAFTREQYADYLSARDERI